MATQRGMTYITPATLNLSPVSLPTQIMLPSNPASQLKAPSKCWSTILRFPLSASETNYKHSYVVSKQRLHCTNIYAQKLQ